MSAAYAHVMKQQEHIPRTDLTEEMREKERAKEPFFVTKKGRALSTLIMIVVVAVIAAASLAKNSGAVTVGMDDNALGVACLKEPAVFIPYDTILEVSLVESMEMARTIRSTDWRDGWCGVYENETYGEYTFYAYSSVPEYIVVRHDGGTLIFNQKSRKITEQTLKKLEGHLEN